MLVVSAIFNAHIIKNCERKYFFNKKLLTVLILEIIIYKSRQLTINFYK
jgi:hypothetical protein